ncbi:methyltransferase [Streptomyces sp. NBC_01304]|uniref:methyltransferase n=1 Tax=Streptomyces sp. NBC_01304 TaxID=2903818 RepID=UPI002E1046E8|nr:methyltransferase [Streptomyces sp. NBC_01304]
MTDRHSQLDDGTRTLTISSSRPAGHPADSPALAAGLLHDLALASFTVGALNAAAVHHIADHLADGPLPVAELAHRSGTHAPSLQRVLRLLAMHGVFHEDDAGAFGLTPAAHLLRRDTPGSQHASTLTFTAEFMQRSAGGLAETVRTGAPAFDAVYGRTFFAHLMSEPAEQQAFDAGMAAFSGSVDDIVADSCTLPDSGTVVDVGGGRGGLLRAVLNRAPGLTGVLFDQPQVVGEHHLDNEELAGRWRAEGGDFFTSVPAGGDLYLLKHVLHDWNDEDCLRILRAVRAAAPAGARLLVVDAVLAPGNEPDLGKLVDIVMLAVLRGRERTEAEFGTLLTAAGFRPERVIATKAFASVVEATAV